MEKELLKKEEVIQDQIQSVETPVKKTLSPKLILIIAIVGVFIILGVVMLATFLLNKAGIETKTSEISSKVVYSTEMKFIPSEIKTVAGKNVSVDIEIDTQGKAISGATIAIDYNPNVISNVTLSQVKDPTSAIANSFEVATTRDTSGSSILFLNIPESTPEQKGKGIVARLKFTPKTTNVSQTEIKFGVSTAYNTRIPEPQIGIIKNILTVKF